MLVLALAIAGHGTADAASQNAIMSGCGIPVYACPDPSNYHHFDTNCKLRCGIMSYPGGCGAVDDDPEYSGYVLWCYQPS